MLKSCGGSNELPRAEGFSKKVDWGIVMLVHSGQKKKLGVGDQGLKQVLLLDTADRKGENGSSFDATVKGRGMLSGIRAWVP